MVNQEILGGLISALERGESLKKSMMSMYNAGYKKEEIEEAAMTTLGMDITSLKELLSPPPVSPQQPIILNNPKIFQEKPKPQQASLTPIQKVNQPQPNLQQTNISIPHNIPPQNLPVQGSQPSSSIEHQESPLSIKQKVSEYTSKSPKQKKDNLVLILLILLLVFLVGILVSLFVFKNQIVSFFSSFLTGKSTY